MTRNDRLALFESNRAWANIDPSTDPAIQFWRGASAVFADKDSDGNVAPRYRTEIRSRWTPEYLYVLFICPYETLRLKPFPNTSSETFQLWNWDVAELFIGSDFTNISRYKEFEVSPQGEWVDLDVDLSRPNHEDGWKWQSGFAVAARVDSAAKTWYGAMRIPFSSLIDRVAHVGAEFRINLFWCQQSGAKIAWQPPLSSIFHVPERFGLLRLTDA